MGAIVEQRDGYGWTVSGATIDSDANGVYYEGFNAANYIKKTIYVDFQGGPPVFISKTFRIYNTNTGGTETVEVTTENLLDSMNFDGTTFTLTQASHAVTGQGYADVTIEGYAITDVTVQFDAASSASTVIFYPAYESGY